MQRVKIYTFFRFMERSLKYCPFTGGFKNRKQPPTRCFLYPHPRLLPLLVTTGHCNFDGGQPPYNGQNQVFRVANFNSVQASPLLAQEAFFWFPGIASIAITFHYCMEVLCPSSFIVARLDTLTSSVLVSSQTGHFYSLITSHYGSPTSLIIILKDFKFHAKILPKP